jgi:putative ABC transport system substrate-binding protein
VIDRRTFLAGTGAVLLAAPLAVEAQQGGTVYRIGLLDFSEPDPARQAWWMALRQRMRELGYVEGQNVVFEPRWGRGDDDRMPKLAAELVGLKVDIFVTGGARAVQAAKQATSTIPIVMATGSDPVAVGLVASLRQPGGNITGLTHGRQHLEALLVPQSDRRVRPEAPPADARRLP